MLVFDGGDLDVVEEGVFEMWGGEVGELGGYEGPGGGELFLFLGGEGLKVFELFGGEFGFLER